MKKPIMLLSGVLAAAVFAGCASTDTTATAKKSAPATGTAQKEEYVQYTSLGSRIPRKVKKSEVEVAESESKETQEAFREIQSHGTIPPSNIGN